MQISVTKRFEKEIPDKLTRHINNRRKVDVFYKGQIITADYDSLIFKPTNYTLT